MTIRLLSWQSFGIILATAAVCLIGGATFYDAKRHDWAEPNLKAMRTYRASLMTDEQIRKLNADAIADAARYKKIDLEMREKGFNETAASAQRCADIVYRERNATECSRGMPIGLMLADTRLTPTADQIMEEYMLGICRFVHSNAEARLNKCLPPK